MKRFTRFLWPAGLLTLCLCLALTACSGGEDKDVQCSMIVYR